MRQRYYKLLISLLISVVVIIMAAIQLQSSFILNYASNTKTLVDEQAMARRKTNVSKPLVSRHVSCWPKKHIAFLKVHKTGSSSMMNMFYRFAERYNLNIVLPNSTKWNFNYLGYGKTLDPEAMVPWPPGEHFHILCNHVVYNRHAFRSVMPSDTLYIGILRDPVLNFMSAFSYYGEYLIKTFNKSIPFSGTRAMEAFLYNPNNYEQSGIAYYIHNKMSFDFGLEKKDFNNEDAISKFIYELDRDFQLVIVLEYLDESLILMKHLLCWEVRDILYLPVNIRLSRQHNDNKNARLSEKSIIRLRKYNKADFQLYDFFKKRLTYQIKNFPFDFRSEVDHFRQVQSQVFVFCSSWVKGNFTIMSSKWNAAFDISNVDCLEMMRDELTSVKEKIFHELHRFRKGY